MPARLSKRLHQLFDFSIALKGIDGLLEIIGGLILLFLSPVQMGWLAYLVTRTELSEDPRDIIANFFLHTATGVTAHGIFVSVVFLLSHGLIKIFLVWELYRGRLWAYPLTIVVLIFFIMYQIFVIMHGRSLLLTGLTTLDVFIVILAWYEYRHKKAALTLSNR